MKAKRRLTDLSWLMVSEGKLRLVLQEVTHHEMTYVIKPETVLMMACTFEGETCYLVVEKSGECSLIHESIKELKQRYQVRDYLFCRKNMVTYCAGELGYSNRCLPFLTDQAIFSQFKTMHGVSAWINLETLSKVERFKEVNHGVGTLLSVTLNLKLIIPVQLRHVRQRIQQNLSTYHYYLQIMLDLFEGNKEIVAYYREKQKKCQTLSKQFTHMPNIMIFQTDYERYVMRLTVERLVAIACRRNKTLEREEIMDLLRLYLML